MQSPCSPPCRSHFSLLFLIPRQSLSLSLSYSATMCSSAPSILRAQSAAPKITCSSSRCRRLSALESSLKIHNGADLSGFTNAVRARMAVSFRRLTVQMMSTSSAATQAVVDDALFSDYRPTCAFLFPGQGAQAVGMGQEAKNVQAAVDLFQKANEILGYDLLDVCINGPKEKLDSTVISQPAIYVTSLAAVEMLRARDGGQQIIDAVDVTCGLSLGEYTALAFAGAFSFEDGLKLVKLRGEAMQEASDAARSAMVSVIGLHSEKVQLLCDAANEEVDAKNKVQIANFLCPGNYAVSGGLKGVEAVEAKAKSFKARMTVRLAVAGAFHTSFMEPAVSRLEAALAATGFKRPRIPVISNVDAQPHSDPATIKKILARQVTSPVQWETTVKTLISKGLKKSYELGPGKVIAGIVKRIDKGADIENLGA